MTADTAYAPIALLGAGHDVAAPPRARSGLLARYNGWLRRLADAHALRGIEPRLARDVGVSVNPDRCPEGYAVDPRPLWGIGLTPQPMDVLPPWARDRRGG